MIARVLKGRMANQKTYVGNFRKAILSIKIMPLDKNGTSQYNWWHVSGREDLPARRVKDP